MKKLTFVFTVVLAFLIAFGTDSEAAASTYKVQKGDTLYKIARTHHVSVADIKKGNHLTSDMIKINQVLKLDAKASVPAAVAKKAPAKPAPAVKGTVVKEFKVTATAYTGSCKGCSGITTTGINLRKNPHMKVISVDPRVIKLGTRVFVEGYGYAIAGDTGSSVKGKKIDVFIPTRAAALKWGRKTVKVKILK